MNTSYDHAYKLGCGRLLFDHGTINALGQEIQRLGTCAYVLTGTTTWKATAEKVQSVLHAEHIPHSLMCYDGPCHEEEARVIAERCLTGRCDVIVGIGGGRIMDFAKAVAECSGYPLINIPTISATCAAFTPLSVMYTRKGACLGSWYYRREVDCVICDLDILCTQPSRCLVSGMVDAMAKWVEIEHYNLNKTVACDVSLACILARQIYKDLMENGVRALEQLRNGINGQELRNAIFHSIVTAGVVSGISRGMYQTAIAHGLYESVRTCFTEHCKGAMHGEIVGVGMLLQRRWIKKADCDIQDFFEKTGMPTHLSELGIPIGKKELAILCKTEIMRRYLSDDPSAVECFLSLLISLG